ncbi:MAG TPA: hypothetical protein VNA12_10920 [Mycobacteriales bacterium]|nr:hypothetical protein [Mycobacteriales bacterium]
MAHLGLDDVESLRERLRRRRREQCAAARPHQLATAEPPAYDIAVELAGQQHPTAQSRLKREFRIHPSTMRSAAAARSFSE